jgi:hypothetical protein
MPSGFQIDLLVLFDVVRWFSANMKATLASSSSTYLQTYVALQPIFGKYLLKQISQCLPALSTVRPISDP